MLLSSLCGRIGVGFFGMLFQYIIRLIHYFGTICIIYIHCRRRGGDSVTLPTENSIVNQRYVCSSLWYVRGMGIFGNCAQLSIMKWVLEMT